MPNYVKKDSFTGHVAKETWNELSNNPYKTGGNFILTTLIVTGIVKGSKAISKAIKKRKAKAKY